MSSPGGPAAKTERLLNLVLCLLYTRRPLPKSKIREVVPQYGAAASDEAFDRMFERDKDELRELGIPLVTEETSSIWEDETGYRIDQREYALPDIAFEPDELAVLGLASRTWAHASLAGPAAQALRKLKADGIERDVESLISGPARRVGRHDAFEVPADHRPRDMIRTTEGEQTTQHATLRAREGRGLSLRRRATRVTESTDGWSVIEVEYSDPESFADEVTGYGPDVLVLDPEEVRGSVVRRLEGAAAAHPGEDA